MQILVWLQDNCMLSCNAGSEIHLKSQRSLASGALYHQSFQRPYSCDLQLFAQVATTLKPVWTADALKTLDANSFYNAFSRTGITYGPHFRGVLHVTIDTDPVAHMR